MPDISGRAERVPASPIRKLVPLALAAKRRGVGVYQLNIGQPDVPTAPAFLEAVRGWAGTVVAYEHSQGTEVLIEAWRSYYQRCGCSLEPAQIQVTTGGSEALGFALAAAANPGEKVLVFEPFYTNYAGFAAQLGLELVGVPTPAESGYHLPPVGEIEAHVDPAVRALILCHPNNPTGTLYADGELEMLADLCLRRNLFLIADEVYREFCYEGRHRSVLTFERLESHAIVVDSVSKRLSACGARVGALVSRNPAVMAAALRMAQARLSSPSLEMAGAAASLQSPDTPDFIAAMVEEFRARRDLVLEAIRRIPGAACRTPEGAFYLMATLPVDDTERFARWLLTDFELDGRTVMVAPGAGFYVTPGRGRREVRIAYVLEASHLRKAMAIVGEAVAAYRKAAALA